MVDAGGGDRDAGGTGGSDAMVGDALRDVAADGVRDGSGGSGDSGDAVSDGPALGGPVCGAEIDNGALTPSSPDCDVAPLDGAALCASTGPCPVGTTAYTLSCTGGAYGPWLVPSGSDGASMMLVTNTGSFVTRLFSIAPGAARVENVPALTSASNVLAVDPATGNRTIFAGEMPGAWRVRETAAGWRREPAVEVGVSDLTLVTGARVLDADRAFFAYFNLWDDLPRLAVRDAGCWRTSLLPGQRQTDISLDLDAMNRPWTAWYDRDSSGLMVRMAGPDGTPYLPWKSSMSSAMGLPMHTPPILLAGGLAGTAAYPSVVIQRDDGVHIVVPDATASSWTDRILDGTALAKQEACLAPIDTVPAGGCDTTVTCSTQIKGAITGFSAARVASGRTYVAWVAIQGESSYGYQADSSGLCSTTGGPLKCGCHVVPKATSNTMWLVITRADTGAEAVRFTIESGPAATGTAVSVAARGNTLLVAAARTSTAYAEFRYLEVDTTRLP
jgi:hypothetical protein